MGLGLLLRSNNLVQSPVRLFLWPCTSTEIFCTLRRRHVRTPFRAPRANAISERWVKSVRTDWDRNQARPAVGEGFPFPALSIAGRVHIPTMADVSRRPPIIPDGRISRVRFETLAFLPWAFPKFGEV